MMSMDDGYAQTVTAMPSVDIPLWKHRTAVVSAVLLSLVMLAAGIWKTTDPIAAATRMNQALVPASLSLFAAYAFGVTEFFSGILMLIPRYRRWGGYISVLLLIAFIIYIGYHYERLTGDECNCFPWVERAVGPGFFITDGVMLLWALAASFWSKPSRGIKGALIIFALICAYAGGSLVYALNNSTGIKAPDSIMVAGEPYDLTEGRVLLYFFDPECTHCLFAAQEMSEYDWASDVNIIMVSTDRHFLAEQFVDATGWDVLLSKDPEKLREVFSFGDPPHGVTLQGGNQITPLTVFEGEEPKKSLQEIGFVH